MLKKDIEQLKSTLINYCNEFLVLWDDRLKEKMIEDKQAYLHPTIVISKRLQYCMVYFQLLGGEKLPIQIETRNYRLWKNKNSPAIFKEFIGNGAFVFVKQTDPKFWTKRLAIKESRECLVEVFKLEWDAESK
jgi:hypothetical protein